MAFRLLLLAAASWRRLNGHELLPLVRAGAKYADGIRVEKEEPGTIKTKSHKKSTHDQPERIAA